jgi:hypothetical protein
VGLATTKRGITIGALVCLAGGFLAGAVLVVAARDRGDERVAPTPARLPPDATRVRCVAGARAARACALRAVRARAARDHPVRARSVSCTSNGTDAPHLFACTVDLPTTCDAYTARYVDGEAVVTRAGGAVCIHVQSVEQPTLREEAFPVPPPDGE